MEGRAMAGLTIGAIARATGIPVQTLRTWERRYGFPRPERTESGHRRYPLEVVERLRLMDRAIAQGHRASTVVGGELDALQALLALGGPDTVSVPASGPAREAARLDAADDEAAAPLPRAAPVVPEGRRARSRPELLAAV